MASGQLSNTTPQIKHLLRLLQHKILARLLCRVPQHHSLTTVHRLNLNDHLASRKIIADILNTLYHIITIKAQRPLWFNHQVRQCPYLMALATTTVKQLKPRSVF